jgi:hypothetical protein
MTKRTNPDERAGRIAARHHGLITTEQAARCGLTSAHITRRVRSGRWERLARGVFRITGAPATPAQATLAGVLAAGPSALASGRSALALFGLCDAPLVPEITVSPTASARTPAVSLRRSLVPSRDRTRVGPVPCTVAARALLEVAPVVTQKVLDEMVDEAIVRTLAAPSTVLAVIRRAGHGPGRTGVEKLRSALDPWLEGIRPDSPAEVRLLRRLADWGLPEPVRQHPVDLGDGRVAFIDLAWPAAAAGLEYDGRAHHTPRQLAADVAR